MKCKIKDIAIVRSGTYLKEVPEGEIYYLQVNCFDRTKNEFLLPDATLELDNKTENHLLNNGDIIFAAKGTSNFGVVFHEKDYKAVASSSFLVIRIIDQAVISPDYLCWILNREDTLAFLKANAIGSSIPSISKSMIEDYTISIPLIDMQNKIVEIVQLQQQEQQLYERIMAIRNKLIINQIIEITK